VDLTSNPNTEKLVETEVKGRTVYVSERNETAYVETDSGLVSLTNLRAWNYLIEEAKRQQIDGYDQGTSVEEKQFQKDNKAVADRIRDLRDDLRREESKFRSKASGKKDGDGQ